MSEPLGLWVAIGLAGLDLFILLVVFRYQQLGLQQVKEQGRQLASISDDLVALCKGMALMGEQCAHLESQVSRLGDMQARRELSDPLERDYELAEKMLRCGEPIDRIMSECGLARSEVELLRRMQERRSGDTVVNASFSPR